jgi:NADH-quinone oxidoreductase subunit M
MGGVAFKAPVLATLFLIVTLANLAMPGSSNFIGEFMILLGTFDSHIVIALIASVAVIGAAFYALRLFIRAMHNRVGGRVRSFEVTSNEAIAIVPLVLIILALAFYPQFGLSKSHNSVALAVYPAASLSGHVQLSQFVASSGTRETGWFGYKLPGAVSYSRGKAQRIYVYDQTSTHGKRVHS